MIILLFALLLTACGYRGITPDQQDAIGKQISSMMAQIIASGEKMDLSGLDRYLGNGAGVRFFLDGRSYGRRAFLEAQQNFWAPYTARKIQVMEPGTIVFTPDSALWTAQTSSLATAKDGTQTGITQCETWLWQKEEGFWKVVHCNVSQPDK